MSVQNRFGFVQSTELGQNLHAGQLGDSVHIAPRKVMLVGFIGELAAPFEGQAISHHPEAGSENRRCNGLHHTM